jgi:hypothetical protein
MKPLKLALHPIPGTNVYWEAMPMTLAELGSQFIKEMSLQIAMTTAVDKYTDWPFKGNVTVETWKMNGRTVIVLLLRDTKNANRLVLSWDFDYSARDGQNRLIPSMN